METKKFNIKYVLPDGTLAGYHRNIGGIIVPKKKAAFIYDSPPNEIPAKLEEVKKEFTNIWNGSSEEGGGPGFTQWSGWKGCSIDQIKLEVEFIN